MNLKKIVKGFFKGIFIFVKVSLKLIWLIMKHGLTLFYYTAYRAGVKKGRKEKLKDFASQVKKGINFEKKPVRVKL